MFISCYSDICREDPKLRTYQQKAKKEIFDAWDEVDNVMFQMPTGTGKTRLFTSIISDINKYSVQRKEAVKILIIAHRTELIDQIDENLERYGVPHNIIAGSRKREIKYPVHVASIQTITHPNNLEKAKRLNVQFIIIDEAHHALATTYKKLWKIYPEAKRLGVTATPWRMNHQSFTDLFDKLVLSMPVKDFIKQGHLAPYKYFSLKSDSNIQRTIEDIELDKFGEYMESSMEEKMDIGSIRAQLLDSYLSLAEGKKGIIYAINRVHAKHICKEYENAGYRTVCIDSKTPAAERKYLVDKFKRGHIDIIVNVDIFSEGFDCPDIEFIQLARPTRSLVKYLQQVGRGLRKTQNKEHCIILDNVGMYSHFGLPDARRHWKYHFLGKEVDEEPRRQLLGLGGGGGGQRYVDLSEGTEDMELIQDITDVEIKNEVAAPIIENDKFDEFKEVDATEDVEDAVEAFDPTPLLQENGYYDYNFIFWFNDTKKVYEGYIQDDLYFIISELIIDEEQHCVHRIRVGKISMNSWMFWQMEREKVDNLMSIVHFGANCTIFHYRVIGKDNLEKDKFFDYKGKEIDDSIVVKEKFEKAKREGHADDYIDIPVSEASFEMALIGRKKRTRMILINRIIKNVIKKVAIISLQSDFCKKFLKDERTQLELRKNGTTRDSDVLKSGYIYRSDIASFTVRQTEDDKEYLYKYDLNGKLINKGTIADSSSAQIPPLTKEDIDKLWHVFDSKVTSYKYFWFLSIMQLYKEKNQPAISFRNITTRMISTAWEYIYSEESTFSKSDQIPQYVHEIMVRYMLKESSGQKRVEDQILYFYERAHLDRLFAPLLKNVPYRFLSPWITFTNTEDVVAKSKEKNAKCPYSIHEDGIVINPIWSDYLKDHHDEIMQFINKELQEYLE